MQLAPVNRVNPGNIPAIFQPQFGLLRGTAILRTRLAERTNCAVKPAICVIKAQNRIFESDNSPIITEILSGVILEHDIAVHRRDIGINRCSFECRHADFFSRIIHLIIGGAARFGCECAALMTGTLQNHIVFSAIGQRAALLFGTEI